LFTGWGSSLFVSNFKNIVMKKLFFVLLFFTLFVGIFVTVIMHKFISQHAHNITVSVKESGDLYKIYASYNRSKTKKIQRYLDSQLNSYIFSNAKVDATVTLDDHTNFYIRTNPGMLLIRLRKSENSLESYYRVKTLGEGIKRQLTEN
jgi:hypothetical protein